MHFEAFISVLGDQFGIESLFSLWCQEGQIHERFQYFLVKDILRIDGP